MFVPLQTGIEFQVALLAVVLVVLFGVFKIIRTIKPFVINAVLGLLVIVIAGVVGFGVQVTPVLLLLVAFGGVPAALLAIVLAQFQVIFEPAIVVPLLV
jgi:hypothetical protein